MVPVITILIFVAGLGVQAIIDRNAAWTQIHINTEVLKELRKQDDGQMQRLRDLEVWKERMIAEHSDLERRVQQLEKH